MATISASLDERVIARQLGRRPRPVTGICRRCRYGYPQVAATAPASRRNGRWDLFPTVYWLTCPLLARAISRLEAEGWIARYEERLAQDPEFAAAMQAAHKAAAADRVGRVPPAWREELAREHPRQWRALSETGVAGIRSQTGVKCLHAHFADYIGRGDNPIGQGVYRQLVAEGIPLDGTDACWQWCTVEDRPEAPDPKGAAAR
ncbi:MAG: DUF501 domain-containing protein [Limnochordales bacterium]|nr:DUF501 domain-containing protein [Limnochordales bacterium]